MYILFTLVFSDYFSAFVCTVSGFVNLTEDSPLASRYRALSSSSNAFVDEVNTFLREIQSLAETSRRRLFESYEAANFPRINRTVGICLPRARSYPLKEIEDSPKSVENETLDIPFQTPLLAQLSLELVEVDDTDNPFESLFPIHPIKEDIKSITARINLASAKTGIFATLNLILKERRLLVNPKE